jgi:hypothetical protein
MFVKFWIIWAVVGLGAAIVLFNWSLKTRQYSNERQAALIPFDDIKPEAELEFDASKGTAFKYSVWAIAAIGAISVVILLFAAFTV